MTVPTHGDAPTRLERKLGTADAVVIGLGSMIGAGAFAAFAPAARAAGNGLLLGLAIAAFVAYCNATSSAQLAAVHPESGGAYVYGRERLSPFWGFVAGWGFVIGKLASCAAMALTFGSYVSPTLARPLAVAAVVVLTAINCFGVQKTAGTTRVIVAFVVTTLIAVIVGIWVGGAVDVHRAWPPRDTSAYGIVQSAGILFFAFAGYARIATLGEEVVDPARTIPRAIPIALALALGLYALLGLSVVAGMDVVELSKSPSPLASAIQEGRFRDYAIVVRAGAAVAAAGVLLSLIVGVSRTIFAMAARGDLPGFLGVVHAKYKVPRRAEVVVGAIVSVVVSISDIRSAIGFSSFAVLCYYAVTNAACLTLAPARRRWPRWLAGAGLLGCLLLAVSLPWQAIVAGASVLASGGVVFVVRSRRAI